MPTKIRKSNYELVRIISMLMIVCHHILVHGLQPMDNNPNIVMWILDNMVLFGVNLFLLLSGYFTIRFSFKKFIFLMWICSFYKIFHLFFWTFVLNKPQPMIYWIAKPICVPFSTGGWFVDVYVLLFLLSPLINKVLAGLNSRGYIKGLILLSLINIIWGWILQDPVNPSGYSLMHFAYIYYVGYGCRLWAKHSFAINKNYTRTYFNTLSLSLVITFLFTFLTYCLQLPDNRLFAYNNPFVIISSVMIFMLITQGRPFCNKRVNFVAASMLPVYLIHDQGGVASWYMELFQDAYNHYNIMTFLIVAILLVISLFSFTILIDQLRIKTSPFIENALNTCYKYICNRFCKYTCV